jgi:hypothetical protein
MLMKNLHQKLIKYFPLIFDETIPMQKPELKDVVLLTIPTKI